MVELGGLDQAALQEALASYTNVALAFKRRSQYGHALNSLRSALSAAEALENASESLRPAVVVAKAKTRLNISSVFADQQEVGLAYQEAIRAKEDLSRLLLGWWEKTREADKPYLYAVPEHVEAAACLAAAFRALGRLKLRDDPVTARAYHQHAVRTASTLLPRGHGMVSLLRTEARGRHWTDGDGFDTDASTVLSTSTKSKGLGKMESVSTTLPSVRPKTSQGPDYSTSAGSLEEMLTASRPSTSPAAGKGGEEKGLDPSKAHHDDEPQKKTNPFDEFTSSADIEERTRKRMMLEERAQALAIEAFQHQSAYLRSDLKSKSMEELFENRVVFSRGAMSALEAEQGKDGVKDRLKTLSAEHMGEVTESSRMLRSSHKKVNELNKDLEMLNLVADQARGKVTLNAEGAKSVEKVDHAAVKGLFASLLHEEKLELKTLELGRDQLDHLCQFYLRIQAPYGIDKERFRRLLVKAAAKGSFNKARFEDLWQTLLPIGTSDVSFMDLARWAAKCLPVKSAEDDDTVTGKKQNFAAARSPSFVSGMRAAVVGHSNTSFTQSQSHAQNRVKEMKDRVRTSLLGMDISS
jgi:hypothetical protein